MMFKKALLLVFILLNLLIGNLNIYPIYLHKNHDITIEVKGALNNPGLFKIERNATFKELKTQLELNNNADLSNISDNLRLLEGDIIVINAISEKKLISINAASIEELCSLKGIGEKTALKIIDYRENNGGFKTLEELKKVAGIKDAIFKNIKDFITL